MRSLVILAIAFELFHLNASPNFVTPAMTKRNGLTDAQYAYLWSIGRQPQVSQAVARDWMFRASRYGNVTNWLDICGKTNDFAALSYDLQGKNFVLEETNAIVRAENAVLVVSNNVLTVENEILVVSNAVLEVDAKAAQKVTKNAEKAAKKDSKNYEKWIKDTEKARDKSSTEMAEFYQSVLDLAVQVNGEN